MSSTASISRITAAVIAVFAASTVQAQTMIDQAAAMAGNVTPGDSPGFPVTISKPGNYKLASDLDVPALTRGVLVQAPDVTLDLNGYTIRSTVSCYQLLSLLNVLCNSALVARADGVYANTGDDGANLTVRNGTVRGFANHGIAGASRVEHMTVLHNRGYGIAFQNSVITSTRISDTAVMLNGQYGIYVSNVAVIRSDVVANGAHGVVGERVSVTDSVVGSNYGYGLVGLGSSTSTVRGTTLRENRQGMWSGFATAGGNTANGVPF